MLQKAFLKIDVLNPTKINNVLIFDESANGWFLKEYSFTVPEDYNYIIIEYAGGSGGGYNINIPGGGGAIKRIRKDIKKGEKVVISGIIGGAGEIFNDYYEEPHYGYNGDGFSNGEQSWSGNTPDAFGYYFAPGSGGGSTSVVLDGIIYEASGGGGCGNYDVPDGWGGKGGGPFGGARKYNKITSDKTSMKGNDATDPEQIGLNKGRTSNPGYVKIYGNYDPNLEI